MILPLVLTGCADRTGASTETTAAETEADVEIVIGENGKTSYSIITAENCIKGAAEMGTKLYLQIGSEEYRGLKYSDDFLRPGSSEDPDACEILIGATNRSLSTSLKEKLAFPRDYIIAVEGHKIAVYSESDDGMRRGVEDLISRMKKDNGRLTVSLPEYLCVAFEYPAKDMKLGGRPLSEYSIVLPVPADAYAPVAEKINAWVLDNAGFELPVRTATDPAAECEILVGNTGRDETAQYYYGQTALPKGGYTLSLKGTKLAVAYSAYSDSALKALTARLESSADLPDFTDEGRDDAYTQFRLDNYAAGRFPDSLLDSVNPGVLAELSCLAYYEDRLMKGIERGEKWVYTNKYEYGDNYYFDDMITRKNKGANCANAQGWVMIDLGILSNAKMFGDKKGGVYGLQESGKYAQCVADFTYWGGRYTFAQLFKRGHVKAGDIFYVTGHTFIYMGDGKFFATGHDAKWHTDPDALTEDSRKAVFDDFIVPRESCHDNTDSVNYQLRFKDEYIPHYYRDSSGRITVNPMWSKDVSIEYRRGVSSNTVTVPDGKF